MQARPRQCRKESLTWTWPSTKPLCLTSQDRLHEHVNESISSETYCDSWRTARLVIPLSSGTTDRSKARSSYFHFRFAEGSGYELYFIWRGESLWMPYRQESCVPLMPPWCIICRFIRFLFFPCQAFARVGSIFGGELSVSL